jgi:general secretion pathway protein D
MRRWCLLLLLACPIQADEAGRLYQEARKAEREGRPVEAFTWYARAAGLKPAEAKYRLAIHRLQPRVIQALEAAAPRAAEPAGAAVTVESEEVAEGEIGPAEQLAEPVQVRPREGPRSFHLEGDARTLYEVVASAYGVAAVFDPDLNPGPRVRFRMEDASFREAIRGLMALTATFVVPLNERSFLVAADNQQKRNELEPVMAALLPIPQVMTVEEANEVGRAVQQALDIKRLSVDAARRQVYVRDHVTRVRLASALYRELSRRRGEVMIDVELVSASRSNIVNLGTTLPTSFPVFNFSTFGNNQPPTGEGALVRIGGGETLLGIRIGNAGWLADWTRTHGQFLSRFQIRATDGLPASLHIGDRYPIVNAIFSPIVITEEIRDLEQQGQLRTPFPSFTFEDLGLVLKVTPRVHDGREVTLTLEAEFRVLAGASINGLPVISARKFSSAVRLREGQSSLVSGLAVLQKVRTRSGFDPLARVPLVGWLFRKHLWQAEQTELVLSITPRLTMPAPAEQFVSRSYHYGAELRPLPPI